MRKLLMLVVLPLSVLITTSCGDDDDDDVGGENDLIGTWTTTGATLEFTIDGQDLVQFFADILGLSDTEAQEFADLFQQGFSEGFEGTFTFNSDGTYTANFDGVAQSGEWTLSGDTLTLSPVGDDPVSLTIITLNSSSLVVQLTETESADFDDDGTNEELSIVVELTFSKQ